MRWVIIGSAVVCAMATGAVGYRTAATMATMSDEPETWRQRELTFLKSVHDRIEADLAHRSGDGEASLRQEEHAVVEAMTTTASRMAADQIHTEIKKVLTATAPPKEDAPAAPDNAKVPPPEGLFPPADEVATTPTPAIADAAERSLEEPAPLPLAPAEQPDLAQLAAAAHADKTKRGVRIRMPAAVLFGPAGETLDSRADERLSAVAELVAAMEPREIVVIGRGDTVDLARQRAHAVAVWLTAHRLPAAAPHLVEQADKPLPVGDSTEESDMPAKRPPPGSIEILLRRR